MRKVRVWGKVRVAASVMHWTFPLETGVQIPFLSESEKRSVTSSVGCNVLL